MILLLKFDHSILINWDGRRYLLFADPVEMLDLILALVVIHVHRDDLGDISIT